MNVGVTSLADAGAASLADAGVADIAGNVAGGVTFLDDPVGGVSDGMTFLEGCGVWSGSVFVDADSCDNKLDYFACDEPVLLTFAQI